MSDKYVFIHDYSDIVKNLPAIPLSLNPEVSFRLMEKGLRYELLENFYSEKELREYQDEYFLRQVAWLDDLDLALQRKILFCRDYDIRPFRTFFSRFKFLVDTVVIRSRILSRVLEKTQLREMTWVQQVIAEKESASIYQIKKESAALYFRIARLVCDEKAVTLMPIWIRAQNKVPSKLSESCVLLQEFISRLINTSAIQACYHFAKAAPYRRWMAKKNESSSIRICFLDRGNPPIDMMIKTFLESGFRVYFQEGETFYSASQFQDENSAVPQPSTALSYKDQDLTQQCHEAAELIEDRQLWSWLSAEAGCDVSPILKPYFRNFLRNQCASFLKRVRDLSAAYTRQKIHFLIARGIGEVAAIALNAAQVAKVKRVCFQHASFALDLKDAPMDDLALFDYFFASDSEAKKYYSRLAECDYLKDSKVFESSHYLQSLEAKCRLFNENRIQKKRRPLRVLFLPKKFSGSLVRFNTTIYSLPWYYEFLKQLVAFFAEQHDCMFIYKHFPYNQEWAEKSIIPYLRKFHARNIFVENKPLFYYLDKTDRVLMDYPSTGLYEAAAAGLPVLSLSWDVFKKRDSAFRMFGASIQTFSTFEEAKVRIRNFLDADPVDYLVKLPFEETKPQKIFTEIYQESRYEQKILVNR